MPGAEFPYRATGLMKNLQQFAATTFLTLILSVSAFAGDVQFPGSTGDMPAPGVAGNMSGPGVAGDMGTPFAGDMHCPFALPLDILRSALSWLQAVHQF